jgi:serine/threonine protein kinase
VQGAPPSVASDLYALGVLGFLMLTGRYPFDGDMIDVLSAQIEKAPPTVSDVRGEPVAASIEHLIARALAKNPDERHKSAAAFRYELNAVMDMLAMERRRTRGSNMLKPTTAREATIQRLFESSPLPQALISPSGAIGIANRAFDQLVATDGVPDLMQAVAAVLEHGTPVEVRARRAGGELVAWISPFAPDAVHVVMRVDAIAS